MFFDAGKTESALGAVVPPKAPGDQNRNLSKDQFGPKPPGAPGGEEAGAEGAAGAGEAGAGAAAGGEAAELLPLLLV